MDEIILLFNCLQTRRSTCHSDVPRCLFPDFGCSCVLLPAMPLSFDTVGVCQQIRVNNSWPESVWLCQITVQSPVLKINTSL